MQVELKNSSKKLCVIGDPVLHSKSPLVQNTMIQALGLDYIYLCQPVPAGRVKEWLSCAVFAGYAGFNATMPHKRDLVALMDHLDEDAAMYGAVNTVCIRDGRCFGSNTDGRGFLQSLNSEGVETAGKTALLLGAGGAAQAVALKLCQAGRAEQVFVCNRTLEKAEKLCAAGPRGHMVPAGFQRETLCRLAEQADLLVNCTNLGMTGTAAQWEDLSFLDGLKPGACVYDVIYSPEETLLLAEARRRGLRTLNGLGMLVWQAIFALEEFTQTEIDAAAMLPLIRPVLTAYSQNT